MGALAFFDFTIADGATTSGACDLREYDVVAFQADASFDGATISFLSSADPDPTSPGAKGYDAVVDSGGAAVTITITDDRYIALTEATSFLLASLGWTKIVSASTESGAQTLRVIARRCL